MSADHEVVITGVGVVSPIGIGRDAFWSALLEGRSGIGPISFLENTDWPVRFGGEVRDFDPKQYVKPRKSLKLMSREIQLGFASASMALEDASLASSDLDPDRFGVVYGSELLYTDVQEMVEPFSKCIENGVYDNQKWDAGMARLYPLWMLKYLPNIVACHVAIAHDARAHNNSIVEGDASGLLALIEAAHVIERGHADVMVAGGSGSRINITPTLFRGNLKLSRRSDNPTAASRPFDADRDGMVNGEGAAAVILESRRHAEARRAQPLARLSGYGRSFDGGLDHAEEGTPEGMQRTLQQALRTAGLKPSDIGHLNADGVSTREDDVREAIAIQSVLDQVPVLALKSYFGNLGAAAPVVEMIGSLLAMQQGRVPATLNYESPDPACPVNVIRQTVEAPQQHVMLANRSATGQVAAVTLSQP